MGVGRGGEWWEELVQQRRLAGRIPGGERRSSVEHHAACPHYTRGSGPTKAGVGVKLWD